MNRLDELVNKILGLDERKLQRYVDNVLQKHATNPGMFDMLLDGLKKKALKSRNGEAVRSVVCVLDAIADAEIERHGRRLEVLQKVDPILIKLDQCREEHDFKDVPIIIDLDSETATLVTAEGTDH